MNQVEKEKEGLQVRLIEMEKELRKHKKRKMHVP